MANKRSSEIGHAGFRSTVVAVLPVTAVQSSHVLSLTSNHADRHAATDDFAVRGQVCFDAEVFLSSTESDSQASDHFVEDQRSWLFLSHLSEFSQEFTRLKFRHPTLNGLDQNSSDLIHPLTNDLQTLFGSVIKNQSVTNMAGRNTCRSREAFQLLASTSDHFIQNTVIVAVEHHDQVTASRVTSQTCTAEHSF